MVHPELTHPIFTSLFGNLHPSSQDIILLRFLFSKMGHRGMASDRYHSFFILVKASVNCLWGSHHCVLLLPQQTTKGREREGGYGSSHWLSRTSCLLQGGICRREEENRQKLYSSLNLSSLLLVQISNWKKNDSIFWLLDIWVLRGLLHWFLMGYKYAE